MISGNGLCGVQIVIGANANVVAGNKIGTDVTGLVALGNSQGAIQLLAAAADNTIGGAAAGAGNLIANNGGPGVAVGGAPSLLTLTDGTVGDEIIGNRIFANTGPAIDLSANNGPTPRSAPNNEQNFPIVFAAADGQIDGWLGGSEPHTTYRIDVFASAGYGPGGAGEAEDYLGSLDEYTDSTGQVTFAIPFQSPTGMPEITATATDSSGNTSETTPQRSGVLTVTKPAIRLAPGQQQFFSAASGDAIAIQDPGAGPLDPTWQLTLSVPAGTLTFSSLAGLVGSGDETDSLDYVGTPSELDAAMSGMTYTPPPGYEGNPILSLNAQSYGAAPIEAQVPIVVTSGQYFVTSTADSGPGSLRQAILDSNAAIGGTNTIHFAVPGTGVQTIALASPLPAISNPAVIDGTTQRGYAGAPLISVVGPGTGGAESLSVGADATVRGLAIGGASFLGAGSSNTLAIESIPLPQGPGSTVSYQLGVTRGEDLLATAQSVGATASLSLLDAQGHIVAQSDGLSQAKSLDVIDTYIGPGTYSLRIEDASGKGSFTLTAALSAAIAPFQPIFTTSNSEPIACDFNHDGKLDIAVINSDDSVSVLLGDGDGTFEPAVDYPVGQYPTMLVAGDFNGDGTLDLAVMNDQSDDDFSFLLGNGDGTFQAAVDYAVGIYSLSMVAGDFNGDGRLDLAVLGETYGSYAAMVSMFMGNGDGTFQRPLTYSIGASLGYTFGTAAGDFNGDGRTDLAIANDGSDNISVLLANGNGTFRPAVTYAVGSDPTAIATGDFNGDGRTDLAVANYSSGNVSVLLGNRDGTFRSAIDYPVARDSDPTMIVAGDFNGDGRTDLAVALGFSDEVAVLLANGGGTFEAPKVTAAPMSQGLVAGDFNGDGILDLIDADGDELLGYGNGTFQQASVFPPGGAVSSFADGDFNGDGRTDLAVEEGDDTVDVFIGRGDGSFQLEGTYGVGSDPIGIVAGDFNGDGRTDLAVAIAAADGDVQVLLGNGDGTFQPPVEYAVGTYPLAIVASDFNGDGRIDLAVAGWNINAATYNFPGEVSVLLGNGDGTFRPPVTYGSGPDSDAIVAGDFNDDGCTDLAVANGGAYPDLTGSVSVLLGNGDGTFRPQVTYGSGPGSDAVVAGDFNGDGRTDLAVADDGAPPDFSGSVSVLLGNGDGTFQNQVTYAVGSGPDAIVAGDFAGNGHLDLAVGNFSFANVSVLLGNGDGTFQNQVTYAVSNEPTDLITGSFDGNGRTDLVATGHSGTVSILLNNGDGTFSAAGPAAITPRAAPLVADVNGDGTDDALVVDGAGEILYRQGIPGQPGSFEPPVTVNPPLPDDSNPYTSRDIAWLPNTDQGPALASVDAKDDKITFYAYRAGKLVRLSGSLTTGQLPAQIIAADLNGDGQTDLVVRNAGDGSLSVYYPTTWSKIAFVGPVDPYSAPTFLPPVTLPVGIGVSDVRAIDTTGSGMLDLVVTNKLTAQLSVLRNEGNGSFAAPVLYRAGTGLLAIDPGGTPEITSLEATAGVASGPLVPGGPTSLVTINSASNTLDVLAGLGSGRFANPVTIETRGAPQVVRMADFTGNGIDDLAVLTSTGLNIYIGDGNGGFLAPTTYAVPSESDGLTVADLTGDGKLDLLIGDAYGDVLVLASQGNGTFQPYHEANQSIELAVADLTGTGSKDVIYADQGLDRVVVDYGAGNSSVLADQSTGLLQPGAVQLAYLAGPSYPPDLIVANSGSNNVLIYPGLGNGQFGTAINDGHGYFVGTNPVGITVANLTGALPDLVVSDEGSNDVSVLVNQSEAGDIRFAPAVRYHAGLGPVASVVQNVPGGYPNLLVSDSGSNNVTLLPGAARRTSTFRLRPQSPWAITPGRCSSMISTARPTW